MCEGWNKTITIWNCIFYYEELWMMLFFTMPAMKIIVKKLRMVTTIVILTMMMRLNGKNIDKDVGIDEDEEDDGNGRS